MMTSRVLRSVEQNRVEFDPTNKEHLEAFKQLCIGDNEPHEQPVFRQHPNLRFLIEDGFVDVRTMMLHKVGKQYLQTVNA